MRIFPYESQGRITEFLTKPKMKIMCKWQAKINGSNILTIYKVKYWWLKTVMIIINTKLNTHTINPEHPKQLMIKNLKVFYFGTRQARRARSSVMAAECRAESMFMRGAEGDQSRATRCKFIDNRCYRYTDIVTG